MSESSRVTLIPLPEVPKHLFEALIFNSFYTPRKFENDNSYFFDQEVFSDAGKVRWWGGQLYDGDLRVNRHKGTSLYNIVATPTAHWLGIVGFQHVVSRASFPEIGVTITDEAYRGAGLSPEILRLAVNDLITFNYKNQIQQKAINAVIAEANIPSLRSIARAFPQAIRTSRIVKAFGDGRNLPHIVYRYDLSNFKNEQ